MASEKSAKTPAVLDFNIQSHRLAIKGTKAKTVLSRHTESGMHPRPTENETGIQPKQRYDRWDGPRGRQCSPVRHWDKSWDQARPHESQWERSWNQPSSFGNSREKSSWEFNGNSKGKRQTHPGAISPRNRRKNSPRFQTDRAQTESTQEQKTPPYFDSQKLMEMMMKEIFQRKEKD